MPNRLSDLEANSIATAASSEFGTRPPVLAIRIAQTDSEIGGCFAVMHQLRPHLSQAEFVGRIRRQQSQAGYCLVFLAEDGMVKAVAGFRVSECLYDGKSLYVDDLVTDEAARGQGYGSQLFDWLVARAQAAGCAVLTLDSGVQRFPAHRFYLGKGMDITCHHFSLRLPPPPAV